MPDNWQFQRYLQNEQVPSDKEYRRIFSGLKKIDYHMASYYQDKIEDIVTNYNKQDMNDSELMISISLVKMSNKKTDYESIFG